MSTATALNFSTPPNCSIFSSEKALGPCRVLGEQTYLSRALLIHARRREKGERQQQ